MKSSELEKLFDTLFPLNRSITGEGYRQSLEILKNHILFNYIDVKSGTKVFDWEVPEEWYIEEAFIIDPDGKKILDYSESNLHVVNYSEPVDIELDLESLKKHLHTLPHLPKAIPYVTSYYKRTWGFCMSYEQFKKLKEGKYRVKIRSAFKKGFLRIGEAFLPGQSNKEILITTYLCHPSMANNELSGPLTMVFLYHKMQNLKDRYYSYRFVVNPETIGSLSYLAYKSDDLKKNVIGGIVLNCLGGPEEKLSYKLSKYASSPIDKYFKRQAEVGKLGIREFSPMGGSDERQYNSPAINLPIGQMARTIYEEHPEYHNSMDNKEFMDLEQVRKSCQSLWYHLQHIDKLKLFKRTNGFGEPFLSRHDLYPTTNNDNTRKNFSGDLLSDGKRRQRVIMNLLSYSDESNSTRDIAFIINEDLEYVEALAGLLENKNLIRKL